MSDFIQTPPGRLANWKSAPLFAGGARHADAASATNSPIPGSAIPRRAGPTPSGGVRQGDCGASAASRGDQRVPDRPADEGAKSTASAIHARCHAGGGAESARLRCFACAGISTVPTTWSRKRSCAPSPASTRSSPGRTCTAWMITILRNQFRSEYRKRRREVEDTDGSYVEGLKTPPEQYSRVEFGEFRRALAQLADRAARGAASGRRVGLFLRGGGYDLRDRVGDDQEPGPPRTPAARRAARCRQCRRVRAGPNYAGRFDRGRMLLTGRGALCPQLVRIGPERGQVRVRDWHDPRRRGAPHGHRLRTRRHRLQ